MFKIERVFDGIFAAGCLFAGYTLIRKGFEKEMGTASRTSKILCGQILCYAGGFVLNKEIIDCVKKEG